MNGSGPSSVGDAWNQRMRLIRLRRKNERYRFREELAVIPRPMIVAVMVLYAVALVIGILANLFNEGGIWPENLALNPSLASLAVAGVITVIAIPVAALLLMFGYVYKDAQRRGMHAGLWTLLAVILSSTFPILGVIIYLLLREPLPYPCPRCGHLAGARFNFCPSCQCNLHPSCPQCRQEVAESDKFCAFCGHDLKNQPVPQSAL